MGAFKRYAVHNGWSVCDVCIKEARHPPRTTPRYQMALMRFKSHQDTTGNEAPFTGFAGSWLGEPQMPTIMLGRYAQFPAIPWPPPPFFFWVNCHFRSEVAINPSTCPFSRSIPVKCSMPPPPQVEGGTTLHLLNSNAQDATLTQVNGTGRYRNTKILEKMRASHHDNF